MKVLADSNNRDFINSIIENAYKRAGELFSQVQLCDRVFDSLEVDESNIS